ncbi:hypothetical protein [Sphingomonas sp. LHG3406-1]|uniref:hypothetical protein n=1 Tax=Sphingomonas sp. LHG3406-1 TaxID=2804617 RepID=UPI002605BE9D|nr:hypothetical protein [Sphingomonas sp. LHG3406-1]
MRGFDFSSWQAIGTTLLGLSLITIIGVGVRLLAMMTIQQRRERENRQINERLRTLIAAYKTLGGSFTGDLSVDPTHLRDLRRRAAAQADEGLLLNAESAGSERMRRMRDAVEAALADIILLGTDEQVALATSAAQELVAGRPVHTAELVVALRDFIRQALGLDPVPAGVSVPRQGPTRTAGSAGRGRGEGANERGGRGKGGGGMGMGMGMGLGVGGASVGSGGADSDAREGR